MFHFGTFIATLIVVLIPVTILYFKGKRGSKGKELAKGVFVRGDFGNVTTCWTDFAETLSGVLDTDTDTKARYLRLLLSCRSLSAVKDLLDSLPTTDTLVANRRSVILYYKYFGLRDQRNHIQINEPFEGCDSVHLNQLHKLGVQEMTAMWFVINYDAIAAATLLVKIVSTMPRSGGPQPPRELLIARIAKWNGAKRRITLFRIASTQASLKATFNGTKVQLADPTPSDNSDPVGLKAYMESTGTYATTDIGFGLALVLNFVGLSHNKEDNKYIKAIGCPSPTGTTDTVYYMFPADLNTQDVCAGMVKGYRALVQAALPGKTVGALHKAGQIFASWGYDIWKMNLLETCPATSAAGSPQISLCFADLLWPGGYMMYGINTPGPQETYVYIHNNIAMLIRQDLNHLVAKMGAQKTANRAANNTGGARLMLAEIPEAEFHFFHKSGVGKKITAA